MTEDQTDFESIAKLPARDLLRLPLATLTSLLWRAMDETRKAKRREHWLRSIRAMKMMDSSTPRDDE